MTALIDEAGNIYGRLTVLRRAPNSIRGRARWICKCDCGKETEVEGEKLRNGNTKSCGCLSRQITSETLAKNEIGNRYGRLVVLHRAPNSDVKRQACWTCRCDCGIVKDVTGVYLRNGDTKSCGCLFSEKTPEIRKTHHGMANTRLYGAWSTMIQRCINPNVRSWEYYGGRGIKVCDRWRKSFEAFFEDMGPRPKGLTLDRIDNNGNYEPGNCRWTTYRQQRLNARSPKRKVAQGATQCLP